MSFFITLLLLTLFTTSSTTNVALNDDVLGLMVFKSDIKQDPFSKLTSWKEEDDTPCKWVVDFSDNYLVGRVPMSLQKLSLCNVVNLRGNYFTGEFPEWFGSLKSIEILDVSVNNFTGSVPSTLGDLESLKSLNLSLNRFTGSLPKSLGSCVNLSIVDFSWNLLTGNIPVWMFGLRLKGVYLSGNQFSGSVEFGEGAAAFDSLEILDLSLNSLSGTISSSVGNFSSLVLLNLSWNGLIGSVPKSLGGLKAANVIDLSHNWLNGSIPDEIGGAAMLEELRLDGNFFTGSIPAQIQNCSVLMTLVLSRNNISGMIPAGIANLKELEYVDLSFNHLSGSLPKELTNITNLSIFNVSHNDLEGELPLGGFFNTIPLSSVFDNPSLCGSIVNQSCPGAHPKPIVLNPNPSHSDHGSTSLNLSRKRIILSISAIIAIGAAVFIALARGLAHLHQMKVIHYNIKSTNVLIDCSGEAKVGDFGLATLLPSLDRHVLSSKIQSALGYMAPEFACQTVKITEKCDIYGFGILVLEVVTGKKPVEYMEDDVVILCDMVRGALDNGRADGCVDRKLKGDFPVEECISVIKLGLVCASQVPSNRPDMEEVIKILELIQCPSEGQEDIEWKGHTRSPSSDYGKLVMFTGDAEFVSGTQALLNKECELGRGGFGVVYWTALRNGRSVAIKKLHVPKPSAIPAIVFARNLFVSSSRTSGDVLEDPVNTSEMNKVTLTSIHLYNKAMLWHGQFIRVHGINVSWEVYKQAILARFGNVYDDLMIELKILKYETTAREYEDTFDSILNIVEMSEELDVSLFMGGLPTEIEM
nr:probable LRR receptor-like serine/threonine-protein kinase IRK [Tanacetum cinerariifolium]